MRSIRASTRKFDLKEEELDETLNLILVLGG